MVASHRLMAALHGVAWRRVALHGVAWRLAGYVSSPDIEEKEKEIFF
jgi:hypothetical protein